MDTNKISKKLKDDWGFKPLQPGQRRVYELVNLKVDGNGNMICPAGQGVLNQYTIMDYEGGLKNQPEKAPKTIFYITGMRPAPIDSDAGFIPIMGDITFLKPGRMTMNGNEPRLVNLDEFLYFHHACESNHGKPGHVRPKDGYTFRRVEASVSAKNELELNREIRKSQELIDNMVDDDVEALAENEIPMEVRNMDTDEKRAKLLKWASKPSNIPKVKLFSEDYNLDTRRKIRAALQKGVIILDDENKYYAWGDTREPFHRITPGRKNLDSIVAYLATDDGGKVYERIVIETANKKEKEPA